MNRASSGTVTSNFFSPLVALPTSRQSPQSSANILRSCSYEQSNSATHPHVLLIKVTGEDKGTEDQFSTGAVSPSTY